LATRLAELWPADMPHLPVAEIAEWFATYVFGPGSVPPTSPPTSNQQPRRFFGSVEVDMVRPVKAFEAILSAVVTELQRTKGAKVRGSRASHSAMAATERINARRPRRGIHNDDRPRTNLAWDAENSRASLEHRRDELRSSQPLPRS
jgi:hypothetical protein